MLRRKKTTEYSYYEDFNDLFFKKGLSKENESEVFFERYFGNN